MPSERPAALLIPRLKMATVCDADIQKIVGTVKTAWFNFQLKAWILTRLVFFCRTLAHSSSLLLSCRSSNWHVGGVISVQQMTFISNPKSLPKFPHTIIITRFFKPTQISVPVRYSMSVPSWTGDSTRTAPRHRETTSRWLTTKNRDGSPSNKSPIKSRMRVC